MHRFQ